MHARKLVQHMKANADRPSEAAAERIRRTVSGSAETASGRGSQFQRIQISRGVFLSACGVCRHVLAISERADELEAAERVHVCSHQER